MATDRRKPVQTVSGSWVIPSEALALLAAFGKPEPPRNAYAIRQTPRRGAR